MKGKLQKVTEQTVFHLKKHKNSRSMTVILLHRGAIMKYCSKGCPVEYLDEIWIHPHYAIWKSWQSDYLRVVITYGSPGERLIYHKCVITIQSKGSIG